MKMEHYEYDIVVQNSDVNNDIVDTFIQERPIGRIYPGRFQWAVLRQKLNMLGFTCRNVSNGILIQHLFCRPQDYTVLNNLISTMEG